MAGPHHSYFNIKLTSSRSPRWPPPGVFAWHYTHICYRRIQSPSEHKPLCPPLPFRTEDDDFEFDDPRNAPYPSYCLVEEMTGGGEGKTRSKRGKMVISCLVAILSTVPGCKCLVVIVFFIFHPSIGVSCACSGNFYHSYLATKLPEIFQVDKPRRGSSAASAKGFIEKSRYC